MSSLCFHLRVSSFLSLSLEQHTFEKLLAKEEMRRKSKRKTRENKKTCQKVYDIANSLLWGHWHCGGTNAHIRKTEPG